MLSDPAFPELIPDSQNMFRAVEFGLARPETWQAAAELILELRYFIDHSGDWRPWQKLLQKALARCGAEEVTLNIHLLDHSGHLYRRDRDWESSLAAHREEERLARELGRKDLLAQAHYNMATLYWRQREYETAANYSESALAGFGEVGATERQMGGALTNAGLIDYGRGNYAAAVEAHSQAAAHFRNTDFVVLLARSLINLALAQEAAGEIEGAMTSYLEARLILQQTGYEMEKARLELSLGTLLVNLGRSEEAEEAYLRAYSAYLKRSGHLYLQGLATNNLGHVYIEQGRFGEAETILRESLAIWQRANVGLQKANTTGSLAKALAAQGRTAEALSCYDEAIAGVSAFPDDGWARQLLGEFQQEKAELQTKQIENGQAGE